MLIIAFCRRLVRRLSVQLARARQNLGQALFFEPLEQRVLLDASVLGLVINDLNGNGQVDAGEGPLAGVVVELIRDTNKDGVIDPGDVVVGTWTTNAAGSYVFDVVRPTPNARFDVGEGPMSIAMGDLNGDGILDLVVANFESDDVSVLLGNGDGTFADEQWYEVGAGP